MTVLSLTERTISALDSISYRAEEFKTFYHHSVISHQAFDSLLSWNLIVLNQQRSVFYILRCCLLLPPPRRLLFQFGLFIVGLFVCLSAGLWKNYMCDFHETWWKGVARTKKLPIKLWSESESWGRTTNYLSLRLTLRGDIWPWRN